MALGKKKTYTLLFPITESVKVCLALMAISVIAITQIDNIIQIDRYIIILN